MEPRTIGRAVDTLEWMRSTRRVAVPSSEFAGFRFPPEVITLAVRGYLRFGLSYRIPSSSVLPLRYRTFAPIYPRTMRVSRPLCAYGDNWRRMVTLPTQRVLLWQPVP